MILEEIIWSEDGEVMYVPRHYYFTRGRAKQCYIEETGMVFTDVSCRLVWMRLISGQEALDYTDGAYDEFWRECDRAEAEVEWWRVTLRGFSAVPECIS